MRPLPAIPRRGSSTVSINGLLAVSTADDANLSNASSSGAPTSRSRKAARKARNNEAVHVSGVVGLPGAIAAPRRASEAEKLARGRSTDGKGTKTPNSEDPPIQRRASATSSATSARTGRKNLDSRRPSDDPQLAQVWPPPHDGFAYGHDIRGYRNGDEDGRSEAASDIEGRSSSAAGEGFGGRFGGHYMSPDTSPHPSQRSLSSSQYGFVSSRTPWSPHLAHQQPQSQQPPATMASPASTSASRPPSRGSSLSVPVALTPMAPVVSPQQQAYALAQAQLQTQSQLLQHYQQIATMQMQQRQSQSQQQVPPLRRRATSGGLSETSDGFLSPTATATPATPNGFSYPFGVHPSSSAIAAAQSQPGWSIAHPGPLTPQLMRHLSGPPSPYPALSHSASPTTMTFPTGPTGPQPPPHAFFSGQNGAYSPATTNVSGYLASPSFAHGSVQPSPTHAYFNAPPGVQQQQRIASVPYSSRPRLASSVSASATVGGGGKNALPLSASVSSVHSNGTSSKSKSQGERSQSIPSAPLSGGVPLGDPPPSGWKGKLKQAELDADRMGKELEIARWRLAVVEEEQRTAEREVRTVHFKHYADARLTTCCAGVCRAKRRSRFSPPGRCAPKLE